MLRAVAYELCVNYTVDLPRRTVLRPMNKNTKTYFFRSYYNNVRVRQKQIFIHPLLILWELDCLYLKRHLPQENSLIISNMLIALIDLAEKV